MSDKYRPSEAMNKREIDTIRSKLGLQPRRESKSQSIGSCFTSVCDIPPSNNTGTGSVYDLWYNSSQKN